ncbi:MAG: hypothetical protein E7E73_04520, partial [Negativicoccus succinicivorans]|nr:hypothetical protein [Negativicoccus succinicivorans]
VGGSNPYWVTNLNRYELFAVAADCDCRRVRFYHYIGQFSIFGCQQETTLLGKVRAIRKPCIDLMNMVL